MCDTGHNVGGWGDIARQLRLEWPKEGTWRMVIGMVADKDIDSVLALMPHPFVQPPAAQPEQPLQQSYIPFPATHAPPPSQRTRHTALPGSQKPA